MFSLFSLIGFMSIMASMTFGLFYYTMIEQGKYGTPMLIGLFIFIGLAVVSILPMILYLRKVKKFENKVLERAKSLNKKDFLEYTKTFKDVKQDTFGEIFHNFITLKLSEQHLAKYVYAEKYNIKIEDIE